MCPKGHSYLTKLKERLVLVIGGTSGVGFCTAEAALEHGAKVVVASSSPSKLSSALARLQTVTSPLTTAGPHVRGTTCDLSNADGLKESLETLLQFATAEGAQIDHVIYTAGDAIDISCATPTGIARMQTVRFTAPAVLASVLRKYVVASPDSSLTLTAGTNALRPPRGWGVMAGVVSGMEGLARGLAVDLQPIRVNAVMLGVVWTEHFEQGIPEGRDAEARENLMRTQLTGRVGRPEDVAEAYLYCMKDGFVTGTVVVTDGGRLLAQPS
ncbi:putative oxidoreductase YkvO 2 [Colletotrichum chlorophyti]|uniref:Putative oxidoreductase YkvO 2 n=1 Tax=Colletotrichum chlorophyti TaxID=708187 RepID=A0A1Q8S232_9PEZI|nr:putative oxidoreductase YkvO 2 [Colletotrichum chlorophyti]